MSGDNYPHRIPKYNDMERERVYAEGGEEALRAYLGSELEINFKEVNEIIRLFHAGEPSIFLRRMGRTETELWYEPVDFSNVNVLMLEWTHGNNDNLRGIDIPILLGSTPAETLAHRIERNRDKAPDSPFITMVLGMEQDLLTSQAHKAKIILSKQGEIISCEEYLRRINESR
jgi:alpha-galactosidase